MAIEQKSVSYAKEVDDCLVLVLGLLKDIRAGKPAGDIVANNVPALIVALNGIDQVQSELQSHPDIVAATVGSRLGEVAGVFLVPQVQVVPAPQG